MDTTENIHKNEHEHRTIHLEALNELKHKLYEIHALDKFETMNEIFSNIRLHDKDLADTLTLIISDFNTQLNFHQNHFVIILDKIISLEEKRLIRELSRPHNSRASDTPKSEILPQITINTGNVNTEVNAAPLGNHKDEEESTFDKLIELAKENKVIVIFLILFAALLISPENTSKAIIHTKVILGIEKEYLDDSNDKEDNNTEIKKSKDQLLPKGDQSENHRITTS